MKGVLALLLAVVVFAGIIACPTLGSGQPPTQEEIIAELAFFEDLADGLVMQYAADEDEGKVETYSNIADALQTVRTGLSPDGELEVSLKFAVNFSLTLVEKQLQDPDSGQEWVALWAVLQRLSRSLDSSVDVSFLQFPKTLTTV